MRFGSKSSWPAAIGHDLILVLVRPHRDAVERLLEEVHGRRGIEREKIAADRGCEPGILVVEEDQYVDCLGRQPVHQLVEAGQREAEELAREGEIFAQEVEAPEDALVVRRQAFLLGEADLPQHVVRRPEENRVPEGVEMAEIDGAAMGEELLVEGHRIRLAAQDVEAQVLRLAAGKAKLRLVLGFRVRRLVLGPRGGPQRKGEAKPGQALLLDGQAERLQRGRRDVILRVDDLEGPQRDRRRQAEAAGDVAVALPVGGVEIGAALDPPSLAQRLVAIGRHDLCEHGRRRRGEIVRDELLQEVGGELRELVLELELHPGGQEGGAFQEPGDHRVHPLCDEPAKALGDAGILLRELARLLPEQCQLAIVQVEEFPVHCVVTTCRS